MQRMILPILSLFAIAALSGAHFIAEQIAPDVPVQVMPTAAAAPLAARSADEAIRELFPTRSLVALDDFSFEAAGPCSVTDETGAGPAPQLEAVARRGRNREPVSVASDGSRRAVGLPPGRPSQLSSYDREPRLITVADRQRC